LGKHHVTRVYILEDILINSIKFLYFLITHFSTSLNNRSGKVELMPHKATNRTITATVRVTSSSDS